MNRRYAVATLLVLGFASLAYAGTRYERVDQIAVRVFGTLGTNQEVSCTTAGTGRNAVAFTLDAIIRICCDASARLKQGSSSVTAAATDPRLPGDVPEYFNAKGNTHFACRSDTGTAKCTFTEMSAPTD